MSRIGRQPINIPEGVDVLIGANVVSAKGPKGELEVKVLAGFTVAKTDNQIIVTQEVQNATTQKQFGLQRTLIDNIVIGVSAGFSKELEINGVGFRAQMKGDVLEMSLGFSHPVLYQAPAGIDISVNQNIITISGHNKQQVGEAAANIRMFKKPEPYKGKGIRYVNEYVRRKAGKTAAKGGAE
ncbi:50S ribosomal protein L6 [Candidatus Saccharibacteria bacterium]|nr:50S ribosomal protein L6 [Candidatus Saccharibacteria bacterium]